MLTFYCPKCYAANQEGSQSCEECGAPLEEDDKADYTDRLIWALRHPEPTVAPRAAWVLGERRDARAVEPLIELAHGSSDLGVLEEVTVALGKIGDRRAVAVLQELLRGSFLSVRVRAAWALGSIGAPTSRAALVEALTDRRAAVRKAASAALMQVDGGEWSERKRNLDRSLQ